MQVRVTSRSLALDHPDDCTTLTLFLAPDAVYALPSLLTASGAGVMDGDEVLLTVNWIRGESSGRIGIGWNHRFAHMLLQAAERGELTENGAYLRTAFTWSYDQWPSCRSSELQSETQGAQD